jgi:hypothetical protein
MKESRDSKDSIASDLFEFAELLTTSGLITDSKSLYDASEKVRLSVNEEFWEYDCQDLKFYVEGATAGTIPTGIELLEVLFNISIKGIYPDEKNCIDPLSKLSFDLELLGYNGDPSLFYSSWHLDKHKVEAGDNPTSYSHPEYHLAFGGNKMEARGNVFGDTLILPSPRIFYPPMDAILGIDFILQNYFPLHKRIKLMSESKYKEVISNSQYRLWKPYYTSISSAWNKHPETIFDENFSFKRLNPFLDI